MRQTIATCVRGFGWAGLVALCLMLPMLALAPLAGPGAALADDDGGDGSDDDADDADDDDGQGGFDRGGNNRFRDGRVRGTMRSSNRPATAAVPRPVFVPREIIVTDLAETDLALLQTEGFALIERVDLTELAMVMHRLQVPPDLTPDQARDRVRAQPSGITADLNHYCRSEQAQPGVLANPVANPVANPLADPVTDAPPAPLPVPMPQLVALRPIPPCTHMNCAMLDLIGWPVQRDATCRVTVSVGMIDTGVNPAHASLAGADIEVIRLTAEPADPSSAVHGTAVAGLLVGQQPARAPGLIPEAPLIVVDVFGRDGGDERAPVAALLQALNLMAVRGVRVVNMSLSGPANTTLESVLTRLSGPDGAVVLAAAGNGGPGAPVSYPAGYPGVIAVTAVDRRGQIYRRAQRGPHLDLAAPGVEVWSATSISGFRPKTGTSFAVPFATAAAAILMSRDPSATPAGVAEALRAQVRDLGAPGPDVVFGAGLLALDQLCP